MHFARVGGHVLQARLRDLHCECGRTWGWLWCGKEGRKNFLQCQPQRLKVEKGRWSLTGVSRAPRVQVEKPHAGQNPLMPLLALVVVGTLGIVGWKLYNAEFMRYLWIWALGVLVVYWFSVSGGMHNIIRGVPLMYVDQSGKLNLFMNSGQGQLGAEGFMMGCLYTLFGLSFTGMTYLGPRIKDKAAQRGLCYALLVLSFFTFSSLCRTHRTHPPGLPLPPCYFRTCSCRAAGLSSSP